MKILAQLLFFDVFGVFWRTLRFAWRTWCFFGIFGFFATNQHKWKFWRSWCFLPYLVFFGVLCVLLGVLGVFWHIWCFACMLFVWRRYLVFCLAYLVFGLVYLAYLVYFGVLGLLFGVFGFWFGVFGVLVGVLGVFWRTWYIGVFVIGILYLLHL